MPVVRPSLASGAAAIPARCAGALSTWEDLEEPADIEESVQEFIPKDEPLRSETINTLAKMMKVDLSSMDNDEEMINAVTMAATLRVVQKEAVSRSSRVSTSGAGNRRMSADDTLDIVKIVVVGDSGTGKTCLMLRFTKDEFVTSTRATIGMDFCTRQLAVDVLSSDAQSTVQRLTVQVWDTAGQEQFHSLTATYYRKAGGVMICYDSNSRASFQSLPKWLQQVDDNAEGVVKMIVATKTEGVPQVTPDEGKAFAEAHGCMFAVTSSKSGDGVMRAFSTLSSHVLSTQENKDEERETLWLSAAKNGGGPGGGRAPGKKGGCC